MFVSHLKNVAFIIRKREEERKEGKKEGNF
jgi:hypothetical protein